MTVRILDMAMAAALAASDKKAQDVLVLDISDLTPLADYFVICTANSSTQVEAIARAITERMDEAGVACKGIEGLNAARWVLLDFGDVVVHVFRPEDREFYHLERLWGDARAIPFETPSPAGKAVDE